MSSASYIQPGPNDPPLDPRWGKWSPLHDPYVLANFTPRPTDVLITTAPKAGTTWMQQILHQLRTGGDENFASIDRVVPWLELPRPGMTWREVLARHEALANPRIFKTHCTYPQTPGVDVVKIILTSRDPRDCCVSFYHHLMDMTDAARARVGHSPPDSFDAFFDNWLKFAAWFRNVQSWWPHFNAPNVLWLRYEDLKRDLPGAVDRIVAFLGWKVTSAQRERVLKNSSFDWMKAHADKFTALSEVGTGMFKPGGFIRKGMVGGYKTELTAEHERRILAKARDMLPPECLAFLRLDDIRPRA